MYYEFFTLELQGAEAVKDEGTLTKTPRGFQGNKKEDTHTSHESSYKRPLESKPVKDDAKKYRPNKDAFKMATQTQKVMAETGVEHSRVLESGTSMNYVHFAHKLS